MAAHASANDFATLGLRPSATRDEVETAFQQLALQHHPDRNGDPRAPDRFAAITAAYERIRSSNVGHVYRVGEAQPGDDDAPAHHEFIPFDQVHHAPVEPVVPTLRSRLHTYAVWAQGVVAIVCLVTAVGFWFVASFPDQSRIDAYAHSPMCSARASADCIRGPLSTVVDATLKAQATPLVGDFPDMVRLNLGAVDVDVGVSRSDSGVAYGGLQANDTASATVWYDHVVGVGSPGGRLDTDWSPTVIAARHKTDAWLWLLVTIALAIRPAKWAVRWQMHRRARDN